MTKILTIFFAPHRDDQSQLLSRIRNFAEDLDRSLRRSDVGVVQNPDTAVDSVVVEVKQARLMGDALALARAEAKRHHLDTAASYRRHA